MLRDLAFSASFNFADFSNLMPVWICLCLCSNLVQHPGCIDIQVVLKSLAIAGQWFGAVSVHFSVVPVHLNEVTGKNSFCQSCCICLVNIIVTRVCLDIQIGPTTMKQLTLLSLSRGSSLIKNEELGG